MVGLQLMTKGGAVVEVTLPEDDTKVRLVVDFPEDSRQELSLIAREALQIGIDLIAASQTLTSTSYQE